ncbi:MAG: mannose-1-phosphate guanylyltransferase [Planctomycetes bacterium]|nr:mannose-1-phosphate guanylyltransferase [Planctomycetota bacterium]
MKIVIRAGGTGTRLWPWSTSTRPKQFLPMFENKSCVQVAYERFSEAGLADPDDIYVSVGQAHTEFATKQLPSLDEKHLIVEPAKMDTAAAVGLETIVAAGEDPDVTIASLGSDHYVENPNKFVKALWIAGEFLKNKPDRLLTIGCEPTRVETGYGHIKKGDPLDEHEGATVHEVEEFTEKPDQQTAKAYTESGQYLWNANFFVWKSGALMDQFEKLEPSMHEGFEEMLEARDTDRFQEIISKVYPDLKKVAIDYAILEPAAESGMMAVLPVSMGWSDIGSWGSITDAFPPDENGNLIEGPAKVQDVQNCTIYCKNPDRKLITAVGIEDLAVVETQDALLILPRERAGEVKQLVQALKETEEHAELT